MKIRVQPGIVLIEDAQFDYSCLKGGGSTISVDVQFAKDVTLKRLCDEIARRIFQLQEEIK